MKKEIVTVKWIDACEQKEVIIKDLKKVRDFLVERETVGFLLLKDKTGVLIATDINENGEAEVVAIPNKMLISIL